MNNSLFSYHHIRSTALSNGMRVVFEPSLVFSSVGQQGGSIEVRSPNDPDFKLVLPASTKPGGTLSQIVDYLRQSWEDNVWVPNEEKNYTARIKMRDWLRPRGKEGVAPFEDITLSEVECRFTEGRIQYEDPIVVPILVQEPHPNDFYLRLDTSKVRGLEEADISLWLGNRSLEARRIAVESLREALEETLEHLEWEKNRASEKEKSALPMLGLGVLGVALLSVLASLSQKKTLNGPSSPATVEALEEEVSDMSDMTFGVTGGRK